MILDEVMKFREFLRFLTPKKDRRIKYATLVYLSDEDKVLMIKKGEREDDPNSGFYTPPGGKLEEREMGLDNTQGRLEAAVREVEEEAGLTPYHLTLRGEILFDNFERIFSRWKRPSDYKVYIYSCSQKVESPKKRKSGEGVPVWVKKSDIPLLPKNPGDDLMYKWLDDGRPFSGVIKCRGKKVDVAHSWVNFY